MAMYPNKIYLSPRMYNESNQHKNADCPIKI